jgi:hypothetical protein
MLIKATGYGLLSAIFLMIFPLALYELILLMKEDYK